MKSERTSSKFQYRNVSKVLTEVTNVSILIFWNYTGSVLAT